MRYRFWSSSRVGLLGALALVLLSSQANSQPLEKANEIFPFAREMEARHGIATADVIALLEQARVKQRIIDLMNKPAEGKPWRDYRPIFITEKRIAAGVEFYRDNAKTLQRAEREYGVSPEVIVAIIGVETFYGSRAGSIRVIDALSTLAFRFPRRAKFFRKQLEEYVLLSREEGLPALKLVGSYAGAMGIPQFIPSSYRAYAVDFDDDRIRDLISSKQDAIGSVANYLAAHGWVRGGPIATTVDVQGSAFASLIRKDLKPKTAKSTMLDKGVMFSDDAPAQTRGALMVFEGENGEEHWVGYTNFYAITRYNHSKLYALAVHQLGQALRERL